MNKKIILSLSVIGIAAASAIGGTVAYFSYTGTSVGNTFTAGTLKLDGSGIDSFNLGVIPPMAPGEKTGNAVITIKNTGTIPLAWFGDLVVSGNDKLKEAIYIDSATMEFLSYYGVPNASGWPEPTDNFITNGTGSGSYPTWYNTMASSSPFKVNTLSVFDGNNGMGVAPYEFMGALKPGYSYRLTLKFGFAPGAGNEYQGIGSLTVSFKADATQVNAEAISKINSSWAASALVTWMNTQLSNQVTP
jgi:predicted ribosomally synthesized peptide with SipW-like signal peptide